MKNRICRKCGQRAQIDFPHTQCSDCMRALFLPIVSPSILPLTLVCGPPGSGKSTWVQANAKRGDVIIDLDNIWQELTGAPIYSSMDFSEAAFLRRNDLLRKLSEPPSLTYPIPMGAWFIASSADAVERTHWRKWLCPVSVVVFEVAPVVCRERIALDTRRMHQLPRWAVLIDRWWEKYQPDSRDTVIRVAS